jgi:small subunit ribosomal protein S9
MRDATRSARNFSTAVGRRKTAVARVKLQAGVGNIIIDGKLLPERFPRLAYQQAITLPLRLTNTLGSYNVLAKVLGGGQTGQAEAVRHGISRALVAENEEFKPVLRSAGMLTRDARVKERKKYGLKRARKAPQYTKR